jgi:hypothetical protein
MNAVERLWRALERHDWPGVTAQLEPAATVFWPHMGKTVSRDEYVVITRTYGEDWSVDMRRTIGEGHAIAVEATVRRAEQSFCCAAFYDLQGGLIANATEYWFPTGT